MATTRQWSYPSSTSTSTVGDVTTITPNPGTPGFVLGADSVQVPVLVTAPPNSASVFAPASYTAQTASVATVVQNTLGYDAEFVGYFSTSSSSVATFQVGVGAASPPAMTVVATSVTNTAANTVSLPAYVPAGYYYSVQASQANAASVPATLTIVANPV
jgi:hypothetical protein